MALSCFHCGEPIAGDAPLVARVGDLGHPVCCVGCRAATEWIASLGLQDYYRLRDAAAPRADAAADYAAWDRPQLRRLYVHDRGDGCAEVTLLVEGLRCAACSWLIERAIGGMPGVREVGVNVEGRRATIVWDTREVTLATVLAAIAQLGYVPRPLDRAALDDVAAREQRGALKRLVVAALGMMQAMMFAIVLYTGAADGIDPATRDFFRWIGLLVTVPVVSYAARPFFAGAMRELRARRPGMDTPVALAVALVFGASVLETLRGGAQVYFDSASMFVFLLLGGRYLEMRARHRASSIVDALARLQPATAQRRAADGALQTVGVHELEPGDVVVVPGGASVPADGVLVGAACRVDESLLSGESRPQRRRCGERLVAGSVVSDGPAEIRVERIGAGTTLSAIVRLIGQAQRRRAHWARFGERVAGVFVLGLIGAALLTAAAWLLIDPARAFASAVAVLVVACPCAFALAVPAALARALSVLADRGVLVLTSDAIERLVHADHFVFDKTGTLSARKLEITAIEPLGALPPARCLEIAAQLEAGSNHPVAQAVRAARGADAQAAARDLRNVDGCGVEGDVDGVRYRFGRASFADPRASAGSTAADERGDLMLADAGGCLARFALGEHLRPDAAATIQALRREGAQCEILSGDSAARVAALARRVGIEDFTAGATAQQKLDRIAELQAGGATVALVGDGVNDAPALAGADLAVAIGGGADLAHSSADVVLAGDRLSALAEARAIARATRAVMRQNVAWALAYNAVALPLAAAGFVSPWLAAIGMSASSLGVIVNSLRIGVGVGRRSADAPAAPAAFAHSVPA